SMQKKIQKIFPFQVLLLCICVGLGAYLTPSVQFYENYQGINVETEKSVDKEKEIERENSTDSKFYNPSHPDQNSENHHTKKHFYYEVEEYVLEEEQRRKHTSTKNSKKFDFFTSQIPENLSLKFINVSPFTQHIFSFTSSIKWHHFYQVFRL
ncbi:MAG: hypothetical protein ABEH43_07080, partial [Flavobacteriales bacterium]